MLNQVLRGLIHRVSSLKIRQHKEFLIVVGGVWHGENDLRGKTQTNRLVLLVKKAGYAKESGVAGDYKKIVAIFR